MRKIKKMGALTRIGIDSNTYRMQEQMPPLFQDKIWFYFNEIIQFQRQMSLLGGRLSRNHM